MPTEESKILAFQSPATMRGFLRTDPIGYKDGMNWYAYVQDDPVDHSDPSGQYDCDVKKSSGDCDRFKKDLALLDKASHSNSATKEQKEIITNILSSYGKENDHNGVNIHFGALPGNELGVTSGAMGDKNQIVTLDYKKIDANSDKSHPWESALIAGHEGQHVYDNLHSVFRSDWDGSGFLPHHFVNEETSAYHSQYQIAQSLKYKSKLGPNSEQDASKRGYNEGVDECQRSQLCE